MGTRYEQLGESERCLIYHLYEDGRSVREIGWRLGRSASTISRELRRNAGPGGYQPVAAHRDAFIRRWRGSKIERSSHLQQIILSGLAMGWSPEIIAGQLEREHSSPIIRHESIYRYIYSCDGRKQKLHRYLRKGKARRGWRARKSRRTSGIPDRVSIHQRPEQINSREEIGHWEGDLMGFCDQKTPLLVLHERATRLTLLARLPDKKAESINTATGILLENPPKKLRKSITYDNGGEFAGHRKVAEKLGVKTFFCDPYASWQKGGVENAIGRLRPDLPRNIPLKHYTDGDINDIIQNYNDNLKKCLNFLGSVEIL